MNSENGGDEEEGHSEMGEESESSTGGMEERESGQEGMGESQEGGEESTQAQRKPKTSGRRAALRIVRENVERVSKDVASFRKSHEASSKRLEKQMTTLRSEVTALKSIMARDAARAREKQEAFNSKLLSKLSSAKPASKASSKKSPGSSKKKSKGKK
jgi:hypothetical protein